MKQVNQQQEIIKDLSQFIKNNQTSEDDFNKLALRIFTYQYQNNLPYQAFCRQKGKTPRLVKNWMGIIMTTINAFKEVPLTCTGPEKAQAVFMTSGPTKGIRGKHYHEAVEAREVTMIV